jgi:hypothetical protein
MLIKIVTPLQGSVGPLGWGPSVRDSPLRPVHASFTDSRRRTRRLSGGTSSAGPTLDVQCHVGGRSARAAVCVLVCAWPSHKKKSIWVGGGVGGGGGVCVCACTCVSECVCVWGGGGGLRSWTGVGQRRDLLEADHKKSLVEPRSAGRVIVLVQSWLLSPRAHKMLIDHENCRHSIVCKHHGDFATCGAVRVR